MIYKVQARIKQGESEEFYQLLKGGSLEEQAPDGPEILASMDRATVDSSGLVRWTETCYCPTPLRHDEQRFTINISPIYKPRRQRIMKGLRESRSKSIFPRINAFDLRNLQARPPGCRAGISTGQ